MIFKQSINREPDFVDFSNVSIFCGTWNVAAKKPEEIDLSDWILPKNQEPADVYVLGFQEIVDLNAVNVAIDGASAKRSELWQDRISECLKKSGDSYHHVVTKYDEI